MFFSLRWGVSSSWEALDEWRETLWLAPPSFHPQPLPLIPTTMRSSSLSVHPPPSPPSSHQASTYSTPSASYFTNPPSASYPPPYFSSSASSLERLPSSTSYSQPHNYRPSQTTVAARPAPTLTVTSPSPYQDLLGIKALPQLYERIKRLGWIHQNMVMFLMQRQVFIK